MQHNSGNDLIMPNVYNLSLVDMEHHSCVATHWIIKIAGRSPSLKGLRTVSSASKSEILDNWAKLH